MRIQSLSKIFYVFYAVILQNVLAQWLLKGSFFQQSQINESEKNQWSKKSQITCDSLGGIDIFGGLGLNGFCHGTSTSMTLKDLPNHTRAKISFSIYYLMTEEKNEGSEDYDSEEQNEHHQLASFATDTWKMAADNISIITDAFPDFSKKPTTYCSKTILTKIIPYKAEFEHSESNLLLTFADSFATQCQLKGWGIRDLKIFIKVCHFSCKKCSGQDDQCLTCGENACATPDKKYCQCNSGYYASYLKPFGCSICKNNCLECSGGEEDDCTKCKSNATLISGKCICNAGYKVSSTGDCVPCHFTCKECSGSDSNQCTSCYCGGALNSNKECKCLSGYSLASNTQQFTCEKCADSCEECNKENMNICTQCTKNASIDNATQLCACNQGFFAISKTPLRCIACESSCNTCTALFQCSSCYENAEVADGKCVCKSGFVLNPANKNSCIPCSGNCKQCTQQNFCTSCIKNAFIVEGTCNCMDGFYPSIVNGILQECKKCHSTCLKCSGPTANNCTDCYKMSNLISSADGLSGSCKCKDFLYMASESPFFCSPCLTNCQSCSSPTKCTTCFDNMIKQDDGTCKCKSGMFFNEMRRACETCERFCQECKSDEPAKCLSCLPTSNTILNSEGKCIPKPGCFDDNSGEIKICNESCAECCGSGNKRCTACKDGLILMNGQCTCGEGRYNDPLKPFEKCNNCDSTCTNCIGPQSNQCTECKENLISDGKGSCICDKANGWFILNSESPSKCSKCNTNCKTCNGAAANQCLSCKDDQILQNGQCQCSSGYFPTTQTPLKCSKCNPHCKNCSNSSENTCIECFDNASLSSGSCVCNPSYFYHEKSLSCQKCNISCAECSNDDQNCTKCTKNAGLINGVCICKDGFTFNLTNGLCEKCNANCLRCSYLDKDKCNQCTENAFLDGTNCYCASGFYQIDTNSDPLSSLKCEPCHGSCATCMKSNQSSSCTSCDSDFFIFTPNKDQISSGQYLQPLGQCKCRPGFYQNPNCESTCEPCSSNCATCSGSNENCTSCPHQNQIIQKGMCVCPPLTYQDPEGSCISCHPSCASCLSNSENSCILCRDNTFIFNNGTCSCPSRFTKDPSGSTCINCSDNCETCAPSHPGQCLSCHDIGIIDSTLQTCICPPETFQNYDSNSKTFKCLPCSKTCAECQGKESNQCLRCPTNATLQQNGTCQCNDGYFNSSLDISASLICSKCSNKCNTCSGSAETCTSCFCNQTLSLPDKTCICNEGLTQNPLSKDNCCLKCDSSCQTCFGTGYMNCLSCGKNASLKPNGSCVCNSGFFLQNYPPYGCEKCDNSCSECFGNCCNSCTSCSPNSILVGNSCICQDGYFFEAESNTCKKCNENCAACSSTASNCTSCNSFSILTQDHKCICNSGYYLNPTNSGECLPCSSNCLTCSSSSTFCTSCITHSTLNHTTNICQCNNGFYLPSSSEYFNCQKCNCNCHTCADSPMNCTSCTDLNSSINLSNHTCNCNSGYYIAANSPSLKCEKCDMSCKECKGQHQCTQCFDHATLNSSNECICDCGYFMDISTKKCKLCDTNCKTCSNLATQCTSCAENASVINKSCTCNKGFFVDLSNPTFSCSACSPTCRECSGSMNKCTVCKDNATLQLETNTCRCNEGFYQDPSTGSCKPCSSSCRTCNGSNDSDQCIKCYDNSELNDQITAENGITVGSCQCKQHYYTSATLPTLQCQPCDPNCSSCSGSPSNCETCYQFASLTATKSCSCSFGYYLSSSNPFKCSKCDDNCSTCNSSATTCTACKQNATLTSNNTCACDNGYFNANNYCEKCSPECKTCTDSSNKCTSCFSDSTYDSITNKCLCLSGTYRDNFNLSICKPCDKSCSECSGSSNKSCSQCSQNATFNATTQECICNDGFFKNYNTGDFCLACDKTCQTCSGSEPNSCITCKPHAIPCSSSSGVHSCSCQDGFVIDNSTGNCDACNPNCATCNGTAQNNCLTCRLNATVKDGECKCNDGYYLNPISLNCEKCDASCSTCSGPLKTDCTSCTTNALCPSGGKGICQCAIGFFFDSQWLCQPCDATCLTCNGSSSSQCTSCKVNAHPDPSNPTICICNDSYFMLNGTCKKCHSTCATCQSCNSPNNCITCRPNATLDSNNTCQCNPGFYMDAADSSCKPCNATCKNCQNSSTNCLTCYENQHISINPLNNENTCICDSRYFLSDSSPIQQCSICHSTCKQCTKGFAQDCSPCADNASYPSIPSNLGCICNKGFYASSTSPILICSSCTIPNCLDCSSTTFCNQCRTNYVQQPDGSCKVKDGMYEDPNGGDPKSCFPTCKTCTGPLPSQCLSCFENAALNSSTECPCLSNFYRASTDTITLSTCKPCDATCATCSGPTSTECKSCKMYATYDGQSCTCQIGYFFDILSATCQPCDSTCFSCSESPSKCTSCKQNASFIPQTMACRCNTGYFWNSPLLACSKCDDQCQTCETSPSNCLSCRTDSILQPSNNSCKCLAGTYRDLLDGSKCKQCSLTCKTCTYANQCDTCIDHATLLSGNSNLCTVDPHYYLDPSTNTAPPCHPQCNNCSGPLRTDCIECYKFAHLNQSGPSIRTCDCDTYFFYAQPIEFTPLCAKCHDSCGSCNGINSNNCLTCKSILAQPIQGICTCPEGYFMTGDFQCSKCNPTCKTCFGPDENQCKSCCNHSTHDGASSKCICDNHFFRNPNNPSECLPCHETCSSCIGTQIDTCSACYDGAALQGSKCICKSNYFYDLPTKKCIKCLDQCSTCTNSTTCLSCIDINATVSPTTGLCLCNSNFYYDSIQTKTCIACSKTCLECSGSNSNQCTKCYPNSTLSSTNQCICNPGYYKDPINPSNCLKCDGSCNTCMDAATTCTSCKSNACLVKDKCTCNDGYYFDDLSAVCKPCFDNCRHCSNSPYPDSCTDCYESQILEYDGTCTCGNGFFLNPFDPKQCLPCDSSCETCTDGSSQSCLSCHDENMIINSSGACVCKPTYFLTDGICQKCADRCNTCSCSSPSSCSECIANASLTPSNALTPSILYCQCNNGFYFDEINSKCQPCHSSCGKCSGPLSFDCTACSSTTILVNKQCICKKGYYADSSSGGKCKLCDKTCATCSGPLATNCTSCSLYAKLSSNKTCDCDEGTYRNLALPSQCLSCHNDCKSCIDGAQTSCTACRSDSNFNMFFKPSITNPKVGTCGCMEGYQYIDCTLINYCRACHSTCKTCQGNSNTGCLTCYSNAVMQTNGYCKCLDGFFLGPDGKTCQPCDPSCETCGGFQSNQCTTCHENAILSSGSCQCKQSYFACEKGTCNPCSDNCKICSNAFTCTTCQTGYGVVAGQCQLGAGLYLFNPKVSNIQSLQAKINVGTSLSVVAHCHQSCFSCSGPHANECLSCHENSYFNTNTRQCKCKEGFFENLGKCHACSPACSSCVTQKSTSCTSCVANATFDKNSRICTCNNGFVFSEKKKICEKVFQSTTECSAILQQYLQSVRVTAVAATTKILNSFGVQFSLDYKHSPIPKECSTYVQFGVQLHVPKNLTWVKIPYSQNSKQQISGNIKSISATFSDIFIISYQHIIDILQVETLPKSATIKISTILSGNEEQSSHFFDIHFNQHNNQIVITRSAKKFESLLMITDLTQQSEFFSNQKNCDKQIHPECYVLTDVDTDSFICSNANCTHQRQQLHFSSGEIIYVIMKFKDSSNTSIISKKTVNLISQQGQITDLTESVLTLSQTTEASIFSVKLPSNSDSIYLQIIAEVIQEQPNSDAFRGTQKSYALAFADFPQLSVSGSTNGIFSSGLFISGSIMSLIMTLFLII